MFIDTRSRESMESSMSTYLDIPVLRLKDRDILPSEFFIQKELLTWDMLG